MSVYILTEVHTYLFYAKLLTKRYICEKKFGTQRRKKEVDLALSRK